MATINPPIKWHGGKHYLARRIIDLMPPHLHYVEPFAGGLSVLLAKNPEGISEVVNDRNRPLMNFWRVLQHEPSFELFRRKAEAIPFCESTWECAAARLTRPCEAPDTNCQACALAFFVCCRQSLAGRMKAFAPLSRTRVRRGMNEQASAWINAVDGLPDVHARLRRVVILTGDALEVIRSQDGPHTLFYCDPPYLHDTRASTGEYQHEMTYSQHDDLLQALAGIKGKFLLSGYPSPLYQAAAALAHWNRHDFDLPNNAAGGDTKRRMTESVWTNF